MKHRFQRNNDLECLGHKNRRTPPAGLLTEGVLDSNIDTSNPASTRISLWREWRAMLEDLRSIGPVWNITRNGHCVLAVQEDTYPELTYSSDQKSAQSAQGNRSMRCRFDAWNNAVAFESACCAGKVYGVEIQNHLGNVFHKVCLATGCELTPFAEWIQMHQATGLEAWDDESASQEKMSSVAQNKPLGSLLFSTSRLKPFLITAVQREIPLEIGVLDEALTQTARIDVTRASECNGWLVVSGQQRSLYVESEPAGQLRLDPHTVEGEATWAAILVDANGYNRLCLHTDPDSIANWNRLVREVILKS